MGFIACGAAPACALGGIAIACGVVSTATGCRVKDPPPIATEWTDTFDRASIGSDYFQSGGGFAVSGGALVARGAQNHPLWLRKKLPRDVRIAFTATAETAAADIKVELFGDGLAFDEDGGAYTSTGYVVIFGGWNNSNSMIAKGDEHGGQLAQRADVKVAPGVPYKFTIERVGATISWFLDAAPEPFLRFVDAAPLAGAGHEYFGFGNWQAPTRFDNLVITPL
ncbi:MAG: hypothetical protein IPL79_08350 [Myxococcales bacterium]|nr:hypothetical protein [Myxococcales bacterium]